MLMNIVYRVNPEGSAVSSKTVEALASFLSGSEAREYMEKVAAGLPAIYVFFVTNDAGVTHSCRGMKGKVA